MAGASVGPELKLGSMGGAGSGSELLRLNVGLAPAPATEAEKKQHLAGIRRSEPRKTEIRLGSGGRSFGLEP